MSSLTLRRARQRYLAKTYFPYTRTGRGGHKAGNIYIWIIGAGLILFVAWYWELAAIFAR